MNSYNKDTFFSNYYNLQSVHFEFGISLARIKFSAGMNGPKKLLNLSL